MAQCALSPHEFIQNAFKPNVAVVCSQKAEAVCQKNNLSFVELVQPFCKLNAEARLRDPMNQPFTVRNLRVNFVGMNYDPPKTLVARKMLHEVIASTMPNLGDRTRLITLNINGYSLLINNSSPWFESYRECLLRTAALSEHEFTGHFLACVMVVSASDTEPLQEFVSLSQQQHTHQHQSASKPNKWFFPNTLKFYVLVQDLMENDSSRAESLYQSLKTTYGANFCYLLRINSRNPQASSNIVEEGQACMPDPWSQFLTQRVSEMCITDSEAASSSPDGNDFDKMVQLDANEIKTMVESQTISNSMDHPLMPHPQRTYSLTNLPQKLELSPDEDPQLSKLASDERADSECNGLGESTVADHSGTRTPGGQSQSVSQHGICLTLADMEQIRLFVHDFTMRSLLPFVEKQMSILHEAVANRKGLHRSFFSATKKWFGGNRPAPAASSAAIAYVVYGQESVELQMRRLGDLAFMFQNYELAYHAYHMVKKDFNSDQAWLHYAGALEMAALSVFMQGNLSQRQLPWHYFDNAISTYLTTCKSPHFATRATLLAAECLKHQEKYLEAASYFIRLTSEDSDLRSALLLEQASHCFANLKNTCIRKYAFYMILAGHRFNKAGQKKHSLRCYKQALQVYQGKQWLLAEDHINLTAGRLNFNLNQPDEAVTAFHKLLYDGSLQNLTQQTYYVREYLAICSHLMGNINRQNETLSQLPVPVIDAQKCKLILGGDETNTAPVLKSMNMTEEDEQSWYRLEEVALIHALGSLPIKHRPTLQCYTENTDNSQQPTAVVDESIYLQLFLKNPLKIPLCMTDIHLLWTFEPSSKMDSEGNSISNENNYDADAEANVEANKAVLTKTLPDITLDGAQSVTVELSVIPRLTGSLHITGVSYKLMMQMTQPSLPTSSSSETQNLTPTSNSESSLNNVYSVRGMQPLRVQGPRLNAKKDDWCNVKYGNDYRLNATVVSARPRLDVKFHNFPNTLLCGQVLSFVLELSNCGTVGMKRLLAATQTPELVTFGKASSSPLILQPDVYSFYPTHSSRMSSTDAASLSSVTELPFPTGFETLQPGHKMWIPVWIRGPEIPGQQTLDLLFYYETSQHLDGHSFRHRIVRHRSTLVTQDILAATAIALTGCSPVGKSLLQNITLALDISNINQQAIADEELQLRLSQISCISKYWNIEQLNNLGSKDIQVGPKETLNLCFRIVEKPSSPDNDKERLCFSNIVFQDNEIDSSTCPCYDFCQKSTLQPINGNKNDNGPRSLDDVSQMNKNDLDIIIIILWKAFSSSNGFMSYGQQHLAIRSLDTLVSTRTAPKVIEDQPPVRFFANSEHARQFSDSSSDGLNVARQLRFYIFTSSEIKHDFTKLRTCIVPVFLALLNSAEFEVVAHIITSTGADSSNDNSSSAPASSGISNFAWVGRTKACITIQPQQTKVIKLQACFFQHGTYNMNGISIKVKPLADTYQHHTVNVKGSTQLITIEDY